MKPYYRLLSLYKYSLYSVIYAALIFLIAFIWVQASWQAGLLSLFFVIATHPFRYLADDAYRLGSEIKNKDEHKDTVRLQRNLYVLLKVGTNLLEAGFIIVAGYTLGVALALISAFAFFIIELIHNKIYNLTEEMVLRERLNDWDFNVELQTEEIQETS